MWRTLRKSELFRRSLGYTLAGYLWSVARSARFKVEPANIYEIAEAEMPIILTFMTTFFVSGCHEGPNRAEVVGNGPGFRWYEA